MTRASTMNVAFVSVSGRDLGRPAPSLAFLLDRIGPCVPPALIDPETLRGLTRAAARLFPVTGAGFECRLDGETSEIDLGLRITPEDGSSALLAGCHPSLTMPNAVAADVHWQRVIRICRLWCGDGLSLRPFLDRLCVEVDRRETLDPLPRPSLLFFELIKASQHHGEAVIEALLDIFLPLAREAVIGLAQRALLRRVHAIGLGFGTLCHCGLAIARDDEGAGRPVRLVFSVPRGEVAGYCSALGFDSRGRDIAEVIDHVGADLSNVLVQVDVSTSIGPRIGVDLMGTPVAGLKSVLKGLIARRLCSVDKALALADWLDYPNGAPASIDALGEGLPGLAVLRHVNHVKLAFAPNRPTEAKAYLFAAAVQSPEGRGERGPAS